ncbi:hypothetical protein K461DRAFT_304793 [Myriangium duriaei CBS 260.36]|uniref:Uncharacterized protein n=1 Tax=Myriangium duriaei CBS 260.36 TaxID=1168546 RepID=A0A9P4J5M2_9PEZI|nr:hypothetical protein K461DRAFT_304793 [Myriangium duriaei CBS 260.36]
MDLPNLIEAWRSSHGSGPWKRQIQVFWTDWVEPDEVEIIEKKLKWAGWDIVGRQEHDAGYKNHFNPDHFDFSDSDIEFTLRRQSLRGPINAAEPNIYQMNLIPPSDALDDDERKA